MITRRTFGQFLASAALWRAPETNRGVLDADSFRHYVDEFNGNAPEEVANFIPDAQAWDWMRANVPLFTCPDREIEQIYYFRWWTYRKHIKKTPAGFIVTEFLKPVNHAGEYNSLSCAFAHHVAEGRWIHDPQFLDEYIHFWLKTGDNGGRRKNFHQFSGWAAAILRDRWLVTGDRAALIGYLDDLIADHLAWEQERLTDSGLFWQRDVSDGMEESVSGGRRVKNIRPSINSYMCANAQAISEIAAITKNAAAEEYRHKSERIRDLMLKRLWNKDGAFFETLDETGQFVRVRENIGYTPWYFEIPPAQAGYEVAWKQLMDPQGFYAPFGPTTVERRHPKFVIAYEGDDCRWDGPNWPFATTITLRALANVLNHYRQNDISRRDYMENVRIYAHSHHLKLPDGRVIPYIDENLNPDTGDWIARTRKLARSSFYNRGAYYNHSAYADLIITGVCGLRPAPYGSVEVNPLAPPEWDWFCLDRVKYHGRMLTIVWDKHGTKFGKGAGFRVFTDGKVIKSSNQIERLRV